MKQPMVHIILEHPEDWAYLHQCLLMLFDSPLNHAGYLRVYIKLEKNSQKLIELHPEMRVPRTFDRFHQLFSNFLHSNELPLVQTKDGQVRLMTYTDKKQTRFSDKCNDRRRFRIINLAPKLRTARWFSQSLIEDTQDAPEQDTGGKVGADNDNHDDDDRMDVSQSMAHNNDNNDNDNKTSRKKLKSAIISIDLAPINYNILGEGRETEFLIKTIDVTKEQQADGSECCSLSRYPLSGPLACVRLTSAIEEALDIL